MVKRIAVSIIVLSSLYLVLGAAFEQDAFSYMFNSKSYKEKEQSAVKDTIRYYDIFFTDLHATGGMPATLDKFPASRQLKHELFKHIGTIRNNKRVLVYDMANIDVRDVEIVSPYRAEALVFEEWNFIYQDVETRSPVTQPKGLGEGFKYILLKRGKDWIVVDYYPVDMDAAEQKGKEVTH